MFSQKCYYELNCLESKAAPCYPDYALTPLHIGLVAWLGFEFQTMFMIYRGSDIHLQVRLKVVVVAQ